MKGGRRGGEKQGKSLEIKVTERENKSNEKRKDQQAKTQ